MFEHFKIHRKMLVVNLYKPIDEVVWNVDNYKWQKIVQLKTTCSIHLKLLHKLQKLRGRWPWEWLGFANHLARLIACFHPTKSMIMCIIFHKCPLKTCLWIKKLGSKIEGLLPLFWGPTLHIPFKLFCNPSKRKGKFSVNPSKWTAKKK
jgi:hypothetical protein